MYVIAAIGLLTMILSIVMIVSPAAWSRGILSFSQKPYFHITEIASRLLLGALLIFFANATMHPLLFKIFGGVCLLAAIILIVMGSKRHCDFAVRSATFIKIFRPAGIVSFTFGVFMIYSAIIRA